MSLSRTLEEIEETPAMTYNDIVKSAEETYIPPGGPNRLEHQDQQHQVFEQLQENGKASSSSSSAASSSPQGRLETSLGTNRSPLKRPRNRASEVSLHGDPPEVIKHGFSSTRGTLRSPSHHSRGTIFPDGGLKPPKKKAKKSEGKSRGTSVS